MQCAVSLNQRKRICPLFMTLHELERAEEAEEADENEDGNSKTQNEGKERARRDELG